MRGGSTTRKVVAPNDAAQVATGARERALTVSLLRAREAVMLHMRPILRAHGLTEQQWRVLRALSVDNPIDKTTLAERAALLMPSLLRILKDTEACGWVSIVRSKESQRRSNVLLTRSGKGFVDRVSTEIAAGNRVVRAAIGEETTERLLDLLAHVEERLHATPCMGAAPPRHRAPPPPRRVTGP